MIAIDSAKHEALQKPGTIVFREINGWVFGISWTRTRFLGKSHWHFSAQLVPVGRSSTSEDWNFLGRVSAEVGVPEGCQPLTPFETTDPNAVHHWTWFES